jgi:hypothetical protein
MEVELHTLLFIGIANKIFKELLLLYTYFVLLSIFSVKNICMSVSRTAGSCPNCKRSSTLSVPNPAVYNPPNLDSGYLFSRILDNFDGDLSSFCVRAVKTRLDQYLMQALNSSNAPVNKCYQIILNDIDIEVDCTCSQKDLDQGKGPPNAVVNINSGGGRIVEIPCPPPNNNPPNTA